MSTSLRGGDNTTKLVKVSKELVYNFTMHYVSFDMS
jgi:hypothetical protein